MKPSKYNRIVPYLFNRQYSAVYNTFRDTVAIVTAREEEYIRTCDRSLGIHYTKINEFFEKGLIVDENTNELAQLKVEYLKSKFDSRSLSVTLIPTYRRCVPGCISCAERLNYSIEDNITMSEAVQDSICKWIGDQLNDVDSLEICWQGGEPLLAQDVIRRLGTRLKKLAEENHVSYRSRITASGRLLTKDTAAELYTLGITEYSLYLDDCAEEGACGIAGEDPQMTAANFSAYQAILETLANISGSLKHAVLRIDADKIKIEQAYDLLVQLDEKGLSEKVTASLCAPLNFGTEPESDSLTQEEYSCEAILYALEQGIGPKDFSSSNCACPEHRWNSVIIDSHGMVFKSASETGDGQSCGRLKENGVMEFNKNFYEYGARQLTDQEQCQECPYLPLCIGECKNGQKLGNACVFRSLTDSCRERYLNAYVAKRILRRMEGTHHYGSKSTFLLDDLIMGKYGDRYRQFISNAQSTYLLGDLKILAEKNGIALSSGEGELLLQLIQPTELLV